MFFAFHKTTQSAFIADGRFMVIHDKDDPSTVQLHIKNVQEEDAGSYICLAENEAGKAEEKATLTIECK